MLIVDLEINRSGPLDILTWKMENEAPSCCTWGFLLSWLKTHVINLWDSLTMVP